MQFGFWVHSVQPLSEAARVGLRRGDFIVRVNEFELQNAQLLEDFATDAPEGAELVLTYFRFTDKTTKIAISSELRVGNHGTGSDLPADESGLVFRHLGNLGLVGVYGALIDNARRGSPAERAGLDRRDILVAVDGEPIRHLKQLHFAFSEKKPGSAFQLGFLRYEEHVGDWESRTALVTTEPFGKLIH